MPNYREVARGLAGDVALEHMLTAEQRKVLLDEVENNASITTRGGAEAVLRRLRENNHPAFAKPSEPTMHQAPLAEFGGLTPAAFQALSPLERLNYANLNLVPRKRAS